ncbi:hypothetical protein PSHT_00485, partial [Puccinia striiformis]
MLSITSSSSHSQSPQSPSVHNMPSSDSSSSHSPHSPLSYQFKVHPGRSKSGYVTPKWTKRNAPTVFSSEGTTHPGVERTSPCSVDRSAVQRIKVSLKDLKNLQASYRTAKQNAMHDFLSIQSEFSLHGLNPMLTSKHREYLESLEAIANLCKTGIEEATALGQDVSLVHIDIPNIIIGGQKNTDGTPEAEESEGDQGILKKRALVIGTAPLSSPRKQILAPLDPNPQQSAPSINPNTPAADIISHTCSSSNRVPQTLVVDTTTISLSNDNQQPGPPITVNATPSTPASHSTSLSQEDLVPPNLNPISPSLSKENSAPPDPNHASNTTPSASLSKENLTPPINNLTQSTALIKENSAPPTSNSTTLTSLSKENSAPPDLNPTTNPKQSTSLSKENLKSMPASCPPKENSAPPNSNPTNKPSPAADETSFNSAPPVSNPSNTSSSAADAINLALLDSSPTLKSNTALHSTGNSHAQINPPLDVVEGILESNDVEMDSVDSAAPTKGNPAPHSSTDLSSGTINCETVPAQEEAAAHRKENLESSSTGPAPTDQLPVSSPLSSVHTDIEMKENVHEEESEEESSDNLEEEEENSKALEEQEESEEEETSKSLEEQEESEEEENLEVLEEEEDGSKAVEEEEEEQSDSDLNTEPETFDIKNKNKYSQSNSNLKFSQCKNHDRPKTTVRVVIPVVKGLPPIPSSLRRSKKSANKNLQPDKDLLPDKNLSLSPLNKNSPLDPNSPLDKNSPLDPNSPLDKNSPLDPSSPLNNNSLDSPTASATFEATSSKFVAPGRQAALALHEERRLARKNRITKDLKMSPTYLDAYEKYSEPLNLVQPIDKVVCEKHADSLIELIGNTRMELGSYSKPTFDEVAVEFANANFARWGGDQPKDPKCIFVDGGKWDGVLNLMEEVKPFENILRQCSAWPTADSDFRRHIDSSFAQLVQIARDLAFALHRLIEPSYLHNNSTQSINQLDGREAAKDYLVIKLSGMGAGRKKSGISHTEGLDSLIQKVFELFLGVVLLYEGFEASETEGSLKSQSRGGARLRKSIKNGNRLLGCKGGGGALKIDRNNHRDIFALISLSGHMAKKGITIISPLSEHQPWKNLNGLLAGVLTWTQFGSGKVDWFQAQQVWHEVLDEKTIAYHFLMDVFDEINRPDPIMLSGRPKSPQTTSMDSLTSKWSNLLKEVYVPISVYNEKRAEATELDESFGNSACMIVPRLPWDDFKAKLEKKTMSDYNSMDEDDLGSSDSISVVSERLEEPAILLEENWNVGANRQTVKDFLRGLTEPTTSTQDLDAWNLTIHPQDLTLYLGPDASVNLAHHNPEIHDDETYSR